MSNVQNTVAKKAEGKSVSKAEQQQLDNFNQSQIATPTVTAESIVASIAAGIGALGAAFYEQEQRILADNGKAYPLDASLPDGVADTGSITVVNRYRYMQSQLCGVVCWKLETMLTQCEARIGEQRASIKRMVSQISQGRATEAQVDRLADFLEVLIEQRAMLEVAFTESLSAYEAAVGEVFETAALRAERERAVRSAPRTSLNDRLDRLGVR